MAEPTPNPADPGRVAFFLAFRRAGGVVGLREFLGLAPTDLEALLDASARYEAERAGRVAEALARLAVAPAADPLERAARRALEAGRTRP